MIFMRQLPCQIFTSPRAFGPLEFRFSFSPFKSLGEQTSLPATRTILIRRSQASRFAEVQWRGHTNYKLHNTNEQIIEVQCHRGSEMKVMKWQFRISL